MGSGASPVCTRLVRTDAPTHSRDDCARQPFAAHGRRRYGPPPSGRPSESVPDIFDEVEEELRSERIQQFFVRYGWALLVLAVVIVLAIGGWRWHEWRMARADAAAATEYMVASGMAANAPSGEAGAKTREAALAMFENVSAHAPTGYQTLARLSAAAMLVQEGKVEAALHVYGAIAADESADPLLRDLATLLWAQRQLDTGDPQLLKSRLEPLAVPGNPWRPLAQQDIALLDIRQKQPAEAKKILQSLATDLTAPPGIRDSAALLLDRLRS